MGGAGERRPHFQLMENLLEIIIPVVIAAIYFFGNLFSKGEASEDSTPVGRTFGEDPDPDVAAREREVRENLRRKIIQRRQLDDDASQSPSPPLPPIFPRVEPVVSSAPEPARAAGQPSDFSWETSDNIYETKMEAQLLRIAETKRQAEQLQQQAAHSRSKAKAQWGQSADPAPRGSSLLAGSVRSSLKNTSAARAAFVYAEVLGRPISLRSTTEL
jgi:hypothetical protein